MQPLSPDSPLAKTLREHRTRYHLAADGGYYWLCRCGSGRSANAPTDWQTATGEAARHEVMAVEAMLTTTGLLDPTEPPPAAERLVFEAIHQADCERDLDECLAEDQHTQAAQQVLEALSRAGLLAKS